MREFETGATRDVDHNKLDYEGFLSPLVLEAFARYMHTNRIQADGKTRASDNWQKGIPKEAYMKSAWRHFMDWWMCHRNTAINSEALQREALCALLFNVQGYLHELLKGRQVQQGRDYEELKVSAEPPKAPVHRRSPSCPGPAETGGNLPGGEFPCPTPDDDIPF
jgi:hypothetical protein